MYQAIHHDGTAPLTDVPRYLARHEVVYGRPALRPYDGLPLGNGHMGGLLYHTAQGLAMQLNHTDAIDFAPDGPLQAWAWEAEEHATAPVACGHVALESDLPCCDWPYLQTYEERLRLADACVEGRAETPFSQVQWRAFASEEADAAVFSVTARQAEPAAWTVKLDRWPSMTFFHHYEQVKPLCEKNLDAVQLRREGDALVLAQDLGRGRVALAARVVGEDARPLLLHSRGGAFRLPRQAEHQFTLFLSTAVTEDGADPEPLALAKLERAAKEDLFPAHAARWHGFWQRSFLHLAQEDYLENLWYLHLYQLNSCGRGRYPALFGGLWTWFHDSRNWGHYYHWNHQQTLWGLLPAGHPELCENTLRYRWDMLPQARADARRLFGVEGAFFSDVSNLNGYNAPEPDTVRNCCVGAQTALEFYRYYRYTGDLVFLRQRAMPLMRACADLYRALLGADGVLRGGATAYESYWNLRETLPDWANLSALLRAILDAAPAAGLAEAELVPYGALLAALPQPATETVEQDGETLEIFCAGRRWDGTPVRYAAGCYPLSPFPASLLAPVWPAGLIGLADAGTPAFRVAQNTVRVLLAREIYQAGPLGCCGHTPAPLAAARMGLAEDVWKVLRKFAETYQVFPSGLMHFADIAQNQQWSPVDRPRVLAADVESTQWEELHEKTLGKRTELASEWFLHCYFEAAANLLAGINEALLQSRDGVIRLFPALPAGCAAMFTLWAEGGFRVTSETDGAAARYAAVESTRGGSCTLADPWPGEAVAARLAADGGAPVSFTREHGLLQFETQAGECVLLYRSEFPPECYYHNPFPQKRAAGVKTLGRARLGLPALW